MSRIGLKPIEIPAGVDVKVDGTTVTVKGPKGELTRNVHPNMAVAVEGNEVIVKRPNDEKENKSLHGLTRTLIHNMVLGVTEGFKKNLEVNGVGYRVQVQNNKLTMNLGFSHQVIMDAPEGITIECPSANAIVISGADKQAVGQFAAQVREKRPPEPTRARVSSMTLSIFAARKAKQVRNKGRSELQWFQDKTPIRQDKSATFVFVAKSAALLLVPDSTYIAPSAIFTFSSLMMLPV